MGKKCANYRYDGSNMADMYTIYDLTLKDMSIV